MAEAYDRALAPGTQANRLSQAKTFIAFMLAFGLHVFQPSVTDILMYIQLLRNSRKTVGTIKNYLSGAKAFIMERGYSGLSFIHPQVITFIKGAERNSDHVPQPAVAIPARTIVQACACLRGMSAEGEVVAACILFAFTTMLRQCHLLYTPHGRGHMLRRRDVAVGEDGMLVTVRSSKTTTRASVAVIPVQRASEAGSCPVQAYEHAIGLVPASSHAFLFLDPGSQRPLSVHRVNKLLRQVLAVSCFPAAASASMHSLRRSGAHVCARAGVPLDQLKRHGMWKSNAVKTYVPRDISGSPQALAAALGPDA